MQYWQEYLLHDPVDDVLSTRIRYKSADLSEML